MFSDVPNTVIPQGRSVGPQVPVVRPVAPSSVGVLSLVVDVAVGAGVGVGVQALRKGDLKQGAVWGAGINVLITILLNRAAATMIPHQMW